MLDACDALAKRDEPALKAREALAREIDALSSRFAGAGLAALAGRLALLAELLRGDYPIRPVPNAPRLKEIF